MVSEGKKSKNIITSAKELQSNIDGLRVLLNEKKVSWHRVFATASTFSDEAVNEHWSQLESGKSSKEELSFGSQQQSFWFLLEVMSRLAMEVTDIRERLVKVEKTIENLHRAKK